MSNIYHLEPPTKGKVVLHTTFGDVDVELWARETPVTCRNFVQLALEGYYDGTLFHRVVRNFMVQGGDPTGTGEGGESIYDGGKPFKDEIHTRLKFTHRGLLAMANENRPGTNTSQFFITLDACEHLKGKHTIFGKVTGDTIFNVLRMGDAPTDLNDRPLEPIKLEWVEVLANPFDDIVPRDISAALRRRQQGAAGGGLVETAEEQEARKREEKRQARLNRAAKKDTKLLSFGDDEEEEEDEDGPGAMASAAATKKKKGGLKSSHDVLAGADPRLESEVDAELLALAAAPAPTTKEEAAEKKHAAASASASASASAGSRGEKAEAVGAGAGGIDLAGADDEAAAFAARMRQQVAARKRKLGAGAGANGDDGDDGGGAAALPDLASMEEEERRREQQRLVKEKAEEYKRLKAEMAKTKSSRAVAVETGSAARQRDADRAQHDMLTPLEARRQKYLDKRRKGTSREDETLAKLSSFSSGLFSKRRETGSKKEEEAAEAYHGQVTERRDILDGGDDDEDDADWFVGGLKFKKHVDDAFRADDYVTVGGGGRGGPPGKKGGGGGGGGGAGSRW